ncbi:MAG TPA: tRNA (cytidine(34)-2'-O)-methyltransferase [Steroidobacteraceae bacterium]|jgi:tRNA (cytidine/uridine-2'-O-)-methyltransferase|nr:tRNA (cytidine(34)-2'-O)-methyltransferase [Steroidobacteraceae bacterium]
MFHVVLFEPEIPPNTGNAIRLCANSGATLHLIKPLGFRLDDKSLQRSGLDYHDLASVKLHGSFEACADELRDARILAVETGGRHRYGDFEYRAGDAFLFGPETRGLPGTVLDRVGRESSLFIPMRSLSRSINLSNSVAIVVYEAWRQLGFTGGGPSF